jgi:hypothetical protein
MSAHAAVKLAHIPGRGRGLITARDVRAGENVLAEEPLLLTVSQEFKDQACANCLCWLSERCPGTGEETAAAAASRLLLLLLAVVQKACL